MAFWLRSTRFQRAFALSAVVLATGGLVLYRAPNGPGFGSDLGPVTHRVPEANGKNAVAFSGHGVHGVVALSHSHVLTGTSTPVYAEVRFQADPIQRREEVRAPLSLAVVLDTSGSMSGDKIADAKRSVLRLIGEMRDDDEIAVVRYSDTSELIQPLSRVGNVRGQLVSKIGEISATGGTNIPGGLSHGLRALDEAAKGRVRRIVLVSDGLDSTRAQAENLARTSFASGITVSSLGIGLDFDESYMGSVAQSGHGNFAFIRDGASLATFLKRELEETATTTVENAHVRLTLPPGLGFVSATGAEVGVQGRDVELRLGSVFAGDERRIVVELTATSAMGIGDIQTEATWTAVADRAPHVVSAPRLTLAPSSDPAAVERGRDGAVFASATSVLASKRQLEAANAYARGDVARANQLTAQNEAALGSALAIAPAAAAPTLNAQRKAYSTQRRGFNEFKPSSAEGKAATKSAAVQDLDNLSRASKSW
jgi:Ca-activated chloride channel homolog